MTDPSIDLEPKNKPRQKRAIETYERVLDVAARLLEDEGVERISTNLIAEKADVTPPTLYRYFPNKYAVLRALGDRLMQEQNEVFERFLTDAGDSIEAQIDGTYENLMETLRVTEQHPGGLSIMRALRAVPTLQQVRLASHHQVTDEWVEHLSTLLPNIPKPELWIKARLTVDIGYAAIEMAMEEQELASETVLREATTAITAYWQQIISSSK
ncbi:MAG: TetR/AcrR family transcriptional regulator [Rhodobiaceae bacterium]|nr:A-factor receptor protein [Rhodobiaceae bacterium]MCR9242860.1 TetR/AcrR family transcriptional regulator [Rhodobiaceae bacterium]